VCWTELGGRQLTAAMRIVKKGLHGGRSGVGLPSDHIPINWEREDIVLDLARWDLYNDEDGIYDGRGGQGL
jgi:hypothetical protein